MNLRITALALAAFASVAALDAQAVGNTNWNHCRGRARARAVERAPRRAARHIKRSVEILEGSIFVGSTSVSVSSEGFSHTSPAAPNEKNNAAVAKLDIPDANDVNLPTEMQTWIAGLEAELQSHLATAVVTAKPELNFATIDVTKLTVRANYRAAKNFTKLLGSEVINFEAVIHGGEDDGKSVKGQLKIIVKGDRNLG